MDHPQLDEKLVAAAEEFATNRHNATGRLYGDQPYISHVQKVVDVARSYLHLVPEKRQTAALIACWCHDLLEDTETQYRELRTLFGYKAAEVIYAVSDELGRNRKERALKTYLKILANPLAMFVKLCDRIVNMEFSKQNSSRLHDMYKREFRQFEYVLCTEDAFSRYEAMWARLQEFNV